MIVIPTPLQEPKRAKRCRWSPMIWAGAALSLFLTGALAGGFVVHDAAGREWLKLSAYKVAYFGNYARALLADAHLPSIRLDMKDTQRLKIKASRDEALAVGALLSDDQPWVTATLALDGVGVPVKMRLKGLLNDHRDTDKWSYRIKMPDGYAYAGMAGFSIQHPKTRNFLEEWTYLESMRIEGLLAPRYDFADVVLNGADHGAFAVEEHLTPEWLESQHRRDGVILQIDDTEIWRQLIRLGRHFGSVYPGGFNNNPVDEFDAKRIARNPQLVKQRDAAVRLMVDFTTGKRSGSQVFDVAQTSSFLALHELWSSNHPLGPPNARFYFNAATGKFEPIAGDCAAEFDRGPFLASLPINLGDRRDAGNSVFWAPQYLQDPVAMQAYVRELLRIIEPSYLDRLQTQLATREACLLQALRREYPEVQPMWQSLRRRQAQLRAMLEPTRTVLAYGQYDRDGLTVQIGNVLGLPVEVLSIQIDQQPAVAALTAWQSQDDTGAIALDERNSVVLPLKRYDQPMCYARFAAQAPRPIDADRHQPTVKVRTRILGHDRELWVQAKMGPQMLLPGELLPARPTVAQALARYPFLETGPAPHTLRIRPGTWEVTQDLVLPEGAGLDAGPGTVLRFSPQTVMLVSGPLHWQGEEGSPIVLEPSGEDWLGLAVIQSAQPSTLRHVTVRGARGIDRAGWFLTGGVTFYESPVAIGDCRFVQSFAEDALNIVRADFDLKNSEFLACASDALDADFSRGAIESCLFADLGGDAIDVSGTTVQVCNVVAQRIADKAVSAGEDSRVDIEHLQVEQARFAIVSKDLSRVHAQRVDIRDSQVAFAAYIKKPQFGPAYINASRVTMTGVGQETVVQTASVLKLNARIIPGAALEVKSLYDQAPASSLTRADVAPQPLADVPAP